MAVDKQTLFAATLGQEPFEVEGIGEVTIRQLSHGEVVDLKKRISDGMGGHHTDAHVLRLGLIEPELTDDEAERWVMTAPSSVVDPIIVRILELAGVRGPVSLPFR